MSFPMACVLCFFAHHFFAGNILAAVHGAAHRLCSNKNDWSRRSRLLMFYYYGHEAHHIAEIVEGIPYTVRARYIQIPTSGWTAIGILTFIVTSVTTLPFMPFVTVIQYFTAWACNIIGAMSFFLVYEVAHRRVHQGKTFFVSAMHRWHHKKWTDYFGMWFSDDIIANYFAVEFAGLMQKLRDLEDTAIWWIPSTEGLLAKLTNEGFQRYEQAEALRRTARVSMRAFNS